MKKLLLIGLVFFTGCVTTTRDGTQVGYVSAIEKSGIFCPVTLVYIKTDLSQSQEQFWVVEGEENIKAIKEAQDNNHKIKISYHDEAFTLCRGEPMSEGFVDSVTIN